jgi:hypothetical protein
LVAFNDGGEGDVSIRIKAKIGQQVVREDGKRVEGAFRREACRRGDAERVDLVGRGPAQ